VCYFNEFLEITEVHLMPADDFGRVKLVLVIRGEHDLTELART